MSESPEWAQVLSNKMTRLVKATEVQNRLLRFANLGPDKIATVNHKGQSFEFYLPLGDIDYIQRHMLADRAFYENDLLSDLVSRGVVEKGGVIIDAGTNIGNHAVFFGHYFEPKRLYCFEPQPLVYETLMRNIELNLGELDVSAHRVMLGAEKGRGAVTGYSQANTGAARFGVSDDGDTDMVTLDDKVLKSDHGKVSLIKMDVEGFENEVLKGAANILKKSKPPIWLEVFVPERAAMDSLLAEFGYKGTNLSRDNVLYTVSN